MRIPNVHQIKSSSFSRWVRDFCNKSWVAKIIATILIWLVVSIPFDLYLLVRWGIGPKTFWEEIAMLLVAMLALGWLQGILLFFGIVLTLMVLLEDL
jgi:hypothetical protein